MLVATAQTSTDWLAYTFSTQWYRKLAGSVQFCGTVSQLNDRFLCSNAYESVGHPALMITVFSEALHDILWKKHTIMKCNQTFVFFLKSLTPHRLIHERLYLPLVQVTYENKKVRWEPYRQQKIEIETLLRFMKFCFQIWCLLYVINLEFNCEDFSIFRWISRMLDFGIIKSTRSPIWSFDKTMHW